MNLDDRRAFQDYASSGEIDEIKIGGIENDNISATMGDIKTTKATIKAIGVDPVSLTVGEWVTIPFNTIRLQRGFISAIVSPDPDVGHYISVGLNSYFEVRGGINCEFAANEELLIQIFINGVISDLPPLQLQGEGVNKGISAFWSTTLEFGINDVVELKVSTNTTAFDLTILNSLLELKEDR